MSQGSTPRAADALVRIGVLGGTFDPPHYAHLALAEAARVQLDLGRVLFVPVGEPPHKGTRPITASCHRAALVEAAIADHPAFFLSRADLDRPGPHFTVEMLKLIRQANPDAEVFLLIGGDSLAQLHTWWKPAGIVTHAKLAVMRRPGGRVDVERLEQAVPEMRGRVSWLDVPSLEMSSTDLRRRVGEGLPILYLVPPQVENYIRQHRLYAGEAR